MVCKVCRDEYCDKCFAETHSHGQLKAHPTIPYLEAKQGWQKMVGRVAGEQTYYYNVSTGETRYDKPEEFMLEDELREHHNFLKFQLAAETHAKKVGELQVRSRRPNALKIIVRWPRRASTADAPRRSRSSGSSTKRTPRCITCPKPRPRTRRSLKN